MPELFRLRALKEKGPLVSSRVCCGLILCVVGLILWMSLYALFWEPRWFQVTHLEVWLPALPPGLDGLTILQLSDLHVGPHMRAEEVRRAVGLANRLSPDLIVLSGDFVSHSARYSASCAQELAALQSHYGLYAVLGNHDIWTDADEVAENMHRAGITVLRDESRALLINECRLWLVGIEDAGVTAMPGKPCAEFRALWADKAKVAVKLLRNIPADEPRLLLVHNPDFNELLAGERIDLALSGHTHGGQVRLPFVGPLLVPSCFGKKYAGGLAQGPAAPVYVHRGLGVVAPPVRLGCRPEIALLRLRRH